VVSTVAEPVIGLPASGRGATTVDGQVARFLTVDGVAGFEITFWCGTCALLFRRRAGADGYLPPGVMRERLKAGLDDLDPQIVEAFMLLLAAGEYRPMLLEVTPRLVTPGEAGDYFTGEQLHLWDVDEHLSGEIVDPGTPYYRLDADGPARINDKNVLFEFIAPMQPPSRNDPDTVAAYVAAYDEGVVPTAVAVTIADTALPWDRSVDEHPQHWALTHFLLDGHHKTQAAAQLGRPLRLLSLVSTSGGNCADDYARAVPALLPGSPPHIAWPATP
jgi:hypothetical protein